MKWVNPNNSLPSAIISIWSRNPDGSYNGKDVWITESESYQTLDFEFTPNESGEVFCYIALLTHQDGFDNTDIYVDELRVEEIGDAPTDIDPRPSGKNLLTNSTFGQDFQPWSFTDYNPQNIADLNRYIIKVGNNKKVRLELPGAASTTFLNNTWTGIYQEVTLYAGNEYQLEANMERIVPDGTQYETIVNLYAYKPTTDTSDEAWLGSIDYKFNRAGNHLYRQTLTPTETAIYYITARVFGWGNDGKPIGVNLDNIRVKRVR
mgnify:FL=1